MNISISLENLPTALTNMHQQLRCRKDDNSKIKDQQEYRINKLDVNVIVKMVRIRHSIPEGVVFCGGKLSEDKVKVTISPSNERVEEVVVSHFKSQVFPAMFMAPEMPMFNKIVINGKEI